VTQPGLPQLPTTVAAGVWTDSWSEQRADGKPMHSCGWFRHNWDEGDDTNGTACCTSTTRYTCSRCGKVKHRNNGMG
jgi:hypothetical protein